MLEEERWRRRKPRRPHKGCCHLHEDCGGRVGNNSFRSISYSKYFRVCLCSK
ncbi:unnamed protein product [Musa hybrid cultivar]